MTIGSESVGSQSGDPNSNKNVKNLRVEIDTSPPFGSVKEAVNRFGGSGSWPPFYRLQGANEFDIKKVQEQAAALEKDLIMKELETLDILEELGTTKRIVEDLKQQLQNDAFKCMSVADMHSEDQMLSPAIKEVNIESCRNVVDGRQQVVMKSSPCPMSSPDLILMELKEAKMNLGKTINDLGGIQTSVESLNQKMKKERTFLEKTRERLTPKSAETSFPEERKEINMKPPAADDAEISIGLKKSAGVDQGLSQLNPQAVRARNMDEVENPEVASAMPGNEANESSMKTAEMKLIAARKMEEAAKAAEAVALAEIKALSNNKTTTEFVLAEPQKETFSFTEKPHLISKNQIADLLTNKNVSEAVFQFDEANICRLAMLKLEEATTEIKHSRRALEEALSKVDMANRKQLAAEDALSRWTVERNQNAYPMNTATSFYGLHPSHHYQDFLPCDMNKSNLNDSPKPVLRPTISMRDVLSRKPIVQEGFEASKHTEGQTARPKVALSQMLQELRQDATLPAKSESNGSAQKQLLTQRKKFGFIHISLPLQKQTKKKAHTLNTM